MTGVHTRKILIGALPFVWPAGLMLHAGAAGAAPVEAYSASLGDVRLDIDRRYLIPVNRPCSPSMCQIEALLPDLRPVSPEMRQAFGDNGPGSPAFRLFLSHSPRYAYKERDGMYRAYVARGEIESLGEGTAFGLRRHRGLTAGNAPYEFYSGTTPNRSFVFLQCLTEGYLPAPQCESSYLWKGTVEVKYVYKRRYLEQAAAIHDRVEQLLDSFGR